MFANKLLRNAQFVTVAWAAGSQLNRSAQRPRYSPSTMQHWRQLLSSITIVVKDGEREGKKDKLWKKIIAAWNAIFRGAVRESRRQWQLAVIRRWHAYSITYGHFHSETRMDMQFRTICLFLFVIAAADADTAVSLFCKSNRRCDTKWQ